MTRAVQQTIRKIEDRSAVVGVMGLGYVGMPLAVECVNAGFRTLGFDTDLEIVDAFNQGVARIADVDSDVFAQAVRDGRLCAHSDFEALSDCDVICICVPTPLNKIKDPDLSYVVEAAGSVSRSLRAGQLVILESTTYPGTTREVLFEVLNRRGFTVGTDVFLCYSPERVDPGNPIWKTRNTPKVIGGMTPQCLEVGTAIYSKVFDVLVPVSSPEAAELTKVYENTFRMINIALANELALACDRLGVDVWEVVEAADTKPFGFMKFQPGPGLGGHCIPLDPHYLSWKMRELSFRTRMIEIAGEINSEMPQFVCRKVAAALNDSSKSVRGSRVLILGLAYKKDVEDIRESPGIEIMHTLANQGAIVSYHDPYCPKIALEGNLSPQIQTASVDLNCRTIDASDIVVVVADHSNVDYELVARCASIVVDTRGVMRRIIGPARIVGLSGERGYAAARASVPSR